MTGKPRIEIQVTSDSSDARKDLEKTGKGFEGIKTGAGKAAGALAGIGLAAFASDAVGASIEFERAGTTIDRVFGTASDTVKTFAQDAKTNVGISATEYEKLAGGLGVTFKGMGLSVDDAAGKTDQLLTVAGDMALALGTDVPSATEAMSAALRGEFDALNEFGVNVSQASVEAGLAAKGISGPEGMDTAAYNAAYQQELLNQVLGGAGAVYGGYRAETDTTAEHQDTLTASWEDAKTKLGEVLMPAVETAVGTLTNLVDWIDTNSDTIKAWLPWLAGAAAAVWVLNWALAANPIVLVTVGVMALIGAYILFKDTINGAVLRALQWLETALENLWGVLSDGDFWVGQFGEILSAVSLDAGSFATTIGNISSALSNLWGWFSRNWSFSLPSVPLVGGLSAQSAAGFALAPAGLSLSTEPGSARAGLGGGPALRGTAPGLGAVGGVTVINVTGALDPDSVARQIESLLHRRQRRQGFTSL